MSFDEKGEGAALIRPSTKSFSRQINSSVKPSNPPQGPDGRVPLSVEFYGRYGFGKTHAATTFPCSALIDTEGKGHIVTSKFKDAKWFPVRSFGEIRNVVHTCIENPDVKTVIFDSSADLVQWAREEWSEEHGGKKPMTMVEGVAIPFQYSEIYHKIDELLRLCLDSGRNVILTGKVDHTYRDGDVVSEYTQWKGYKKVEYWTMIRIQLVKGLEDPEVKGKIHYPDFIFGKVEKNGFIGGMKDRTKPYLIDISVDGIHRELMSPWTGKFEDILREVESRISSF